MSDDVRFLLTCSAVSRDSFVLAKLEQAAALRKRVRQLLEEWVEAEAQALLGEMIREKLSDIDTTTVSVAASDVFPSPPARSPARLS